MNVFLPPFTWRLTDIISNLNNEKNYIYRERNLSCISGSQSSVLHPINTFLPLCSQDLIARLTFIPAKNDIPLFYNPYPLPFAPSILTFPLSNPSLCISSKNLANANNGSFGCSLASIFIPSSSTGVTFSFKYLRAGAPPGGIWFTGSGAGDGCLGGIIIATLGGAVGGRRGCGWAIWGGGGLDCD